jgi:PAS domain S-box-containing protein
MRWGRSTLAAGVSKDRVTRAATPLLFVRVFEGLAAWLFFNEFFLSDQYVPWSVPFAFVGYLVLNLLISLQYRQGKASSILIAADVAATVVPFSLPVIFSGGIASPLLLLFPLKGIHYAMVFSARVAGVFLLATVAMLAGIVAADQADLLVIVPLVDFPPQTMTRALQVAVLALLAVGPASTLEIWRTLVVTPPRQRLAVTLERSDREEESARVADVLLKVSDAVSRLTRLDEILEAVVGIAPRSLGVDYCGIALWSAETGRYKAVVASGVAPNPDRRFSEVELSTEEVTDFEWVRTLGHSAVVQASDSPHVAALRVPAVFLAPLLSGDQFFGVIELARRDERSFTQRDFRIADGIARQTAVALERAQLAEESRRLVLAVESTAEGVLIADANRRIVFVNPAFLRTFGYRVEEVLGIDAMELSAPDREWIRELTIQVQRHNWRGEASAHRKDGSEVPLLLNASLIRDDDDRILGAVVILEDISAEKRLQEHMQRADRLAAVGEITAGIAHEINNALVAIFGQTQVSGQRSEAEVRAALARVDGQARRIADIVQGVLGFARPRPPSPEPLDLSAITKRTVELVRHDLERNGIRLEMKLDESLPLARADPQQVQQVLLNLFRNAIQATAGMESRWLHVEVLGIDDRLAIRVTDSGPGIPAPILDKVFDPFFSTKREGSGLGLSVSFAIARAHGGDLQVSSEPGGGATFTLLLPIGEVSADGRFERILLVDDEPEVGDALSAMLSQEGAQIFRAESGAEALPMLERDAWDAVFLDVRLPDLSGPEVYERLREMRPDLASRVVFVTGGLWRGDSRLAEELPPQPILAKPCTHDQVREVLRQLKNQRTDPT